MAIRLYDSGYINFIIDKISFFHVECLELVKSVSSETNVHVFINYFHVIYLVLHLASTYTFYLIEFYLSLNYMFNTITSTCMRIVHFYGVYLYR